MSNLFKFSKSDHIENHVSDPTLEKFRLAIESGEASSATIREILQNSMTLMMITRMSLFMLRSKLKKSREKIYLVSIRYLNISTH